MGEKNSNDISSESTHQIHSKKQKKKKKNMHTPGGGGVFYQSCSKNCEISILEFLPFFSLSLIWDHMGVKVPSAIYSRKYTRYLLPQTYVYSCGGSLPKLLKEL